MEVTVGSKETLISNADTEALGNIRSYVKNHELRQRRRRVLRKRRGG